MTNYGFPDSSVGKESTCNAGDPGLISGLGRYPREGIGYPLQYSGLENSTDCIVHGVTKSRTQLSDFHFISLMPNSKLETIVLIIISSALLKFSISLILDLICF